MSGSVGNDDGRDGWEENDAENSRNPRRMEESMVSYLTSLDKQLTSGPDVDEESRAILVDNVLAEMKSCTASAACDRRVHTIVEKICYAASITNLIEILRRFTDYAVFIARNRHSSHIAQAIMARLCSLLKFAGVESGEQESELIEALLAFATPVLAEISWLAKELSASHVIRALICILVGMPVVSARKGKQSKHQHSMELCESLDNLLEPQRFYISKTCTFPVPDEFHETLGVGLASLAALSTADLQDLVADSSSSAVLGLAMRVVSCPDLVQGGPELGERLARQIINWDESEEGASVGAPVFYGMSADKAGSYFLEATVECCSLPLFMALCANAVVGRASEYAQEGTSNFVLQSVLRRLSAEILNGGSGDIGVDQLSSLGKSLLKELLSTDVFRLLVTTKGGVVLWMLELAIAMPKPGEGKTGSKTTDWVDKVGRALLGVWNDVTSAEKDKVDREDKEDKEGETKESGDASESKLDMLVKTLSRCLSPKEDSIGEAEEAAIAARNRAKNKKKKKSKFAEVAAPVDRNPAQLLHARLVGVLLKANNTVSFSLVVNALARLSPQLLLHLCVNGPLSRAIMDPFFDTAPSSVVNTFLVSFRSNLVQLASHYLGQFIIRRAFDRADAEGKYIIADSILQDKDNLKRSKEGRASLEACSVDMLIREPEEWHRMVKRQARGTQILAELESFTTQGAASKLVDKSKDHKMESDVVDTSEPAPRISVERVACSHEYQSSGKDYSKLRKRKVDHSSQPSKQSSADFDKISKLRGSNLGLNLGAEVERMQKERKRHH